MLFSREIAFQLGIPQQLGALPATDHRSGA
jgi:hypothetical protein